MAGIAWAVYGEHFCVGTRRALSSATKRVPAWIVRGWCGISCLHFETIKKAFEADGFTVVPGRPRVHTLDEDGTGAENLRRGWCRYTPDGLIEYCPEKFEADMRALCQEWSKCPESNT
jgi:hypothetical protein